MAGLTDQEIDRNRCILMYDDETVADAVAALRDAQGAEWWHLVVDTNGGYGTAPYSSLNDLVKKGQTEFLSKTLGTLVGDALPKVEVMGDQAMADGDALKAQAANTASHVAVITKNGDFRGIITAGATRSGGLFSSDLVGLAGQYAELPKKGLLGSRRRQEAVARKSAKSG